MDKLTQLDRIAHNAELPMSERAAAIREFSALMGFGPEDYEGLTDAEIVAEWCE